MGNYSENFLKFSLLVLGLIMIFVCCEFGIWEGFFLGFYFVDFGWNFEKCL